MKKLYSTIFALALASGAMAQNEVPAFPERKALHAMPPQVDVAQTARQLSTM